MAAQTGEFGERVVSVRAIVMSWDDRYSGWQPLDGGGVSSITLYQRLRSFGEVGTSTEAEPGPSHTPLVSTPSSPTYEYTIRGERLEDREVTLHCRVTKDINYRQVMPTFHHWHVGDRKFGLKFMSSYEGSKFHNRLQKAIDHLYQQSKSSSGGSNGDTEDLEDDVFVPVELPLSRAESWESGVTARSMPSEAVASTHRLPPVGSTIVPAIVHFPPPTAPSVVSKKKKISAVSATGVPSEFGVRPSGRTPTWPKTPTSAEVFQKTSTAATPYPQVYFDKATSSITSLMKPPAQILHRPASTGGLPGSASQSQLTAQQSSMRSVTLARPSTGLEKRESTSSLKIPLIHHLPPPIGQSQRDRRSRTPRSSTGRASPTPMSMLRPERCFYCKAPYMERDNRRGACPNAPDSCAKWIRRGTCVWCADKLFAQCCRDLNNGDELRDADICSCSSDVPFRSTRWTFLTSLSLLVPCLCLYPPLWMCYRGCRRLGYVGGRHRASGSTQSSASGGRSSSAARMSTPEASSGHYK